MPATVLPQLIEIESDLVAQEEALIVQLEAIRGKLNGVRAVLPLFGSTPDTETTESAMPLGIATATTPPDSEDSHREAASEAAHEAAHEAAADSPAPAVTATAKTTPKKAASKRTAKESTKSSAKGSTRVTTRVTTQKKKDGRAADWQKYARPGVRNQSIPEAVRLILETQPSKGFKIAEVMAALFKDGMPKAQYLKARNRVSNVLSGGVRSGEWYRGERSTYSMTSA